MLRSNIALGVGAWVALFPWLGFPYSVVKIVLFVTGLVILGLGISLRRDPEGKETFIQEAEGVIHDVAARIESKAHEVRLAIETHEKGVTEQANPPLITPPPKDTHTI
jgi:hypothetical protein